MAAGHSVEARLAVYIVTGLPEQLPLCDGGAAGECLLLPPTCRAHVDLPLRLPAGSGATEAAAAACVEALSDARQRWGQQQAPLEAALVPAAGGRAQLDAIAALQRAAPAMFLIACHPDATEDPALRIAAFSAGANMVTASSAAVHEALSRVAATQLGGHITCDWCGVTGLTPAGYYHHQPLHHIYERNLQGHCQVCDRSTSNIARHLHDHHEPSGRPAEERTGVFALVVVRRPEDGKFLVTQEFAGSGFWLPGGGADPGEPLTSAAEREAIEEAGVAVTLTGTLAFESHAAGAWRRVIFFGEPFKRRDSGIGSSSGEHSSNQDQQQRQQQRQQQQEEEQQRVSLPAVHDSPKSVPDFESAGACWVSIDQLSAVPIRSKPEVEWFWRVAAGHLPAPLAMPPEWAPVFSDWRFS